MKTYFAKWLPVEGEIKEGDKFKVKGLNTVLNANSSDEGIDGRQKVKLFICSRDVQVGDDIWFTGLSGKLKQAHFYGITKSHEGTDIVNITPELKGTGFDLGTDGFKVIGEISPDALAYVKEGDEFDDGDWQLNDRWFRDKNDDNFAKTFVQIFLYSVDNKFH